MYFGAIIDRLLSSISVRPARRGHDQAAVDALLADERQWREDLGIGAETPGGWTIKAALGVEHESPAEETFLIARLHRRLNGVPVGIVALRRLSHSTGELPRLYVRPEARGLGAGSALLAAAMIVGRQHGYSRLFIDTSSGAAKGGIGLCGRAGFEPREHCSLCVPGGTALSFDLRSAA